MGNNKSKQSESPTPKKKQSTKTQEIRITKNQSPSLPKMERQKLKKLSLNDEARISPHPYPHPYNAPMSPVFQPQMGIFPDLNYAPGFIIPPPPFSSNSNKYSSNSVTKQTNSQWMAIQQIQSMPMEKQKKYWKWYFLKYCSEQENTVPKPYSESMQVGLSDTIKPIQAIEYLNPYSKNKIFTLLNSMKPQVKQQIIGKYKDLAMKNSIVHVDMGSKQRYKPKFQCLEKQDNVIYEHIQEDNVFKQTFSIQLPENSEMSEVGVEVE